MSKVIVYIDGFNLYHGLVDKGWRRYLWLNVPRMASDLMKINQELVSTKYFTARIRIGDDAKKQRQTTYIEALQTLPNLEIIEGKYHSALPPFNPPERPKAFSKSKGLSYDLWGDLEPGISLRICLSAHRMACRRCQDPTLMVF